MASQQKTSRKAAGTRAAIRRPQARAANGRANGGDTGDDIGLDALVGHAGYAVRRFQLWIFQDFVKTLATVDIRPTQYSVMTVIGANPGLSQMAVAKRLGIERARLVHLLDSLEERAFVSRIPSAGFALADFMATVAAFCSVAATGGIAFCAADCDAPTVAPIVNVIVANVLGTRM